ncbi:MAG: response regulator [Smithellaceae bacterium]|nr:response regulator [Smithellaceae bacterium]
MKKNLPVLLVEDDLVDQMTLKRAFRDLGLTGRLDIARNGLEALEFLKNNPRPAFILLDLNMPRMNGFEFLQVQKHSAEWQMIPVVVLTTSREERDKRESFMLGVAGYIIKPVDYPEFVEAMRTIDR